MGSGPRPGARPLIGCAKRQFVLLFPPVRIRRMIVRHACQHPGNPVPPGPAIHLTAPAACRICRRAFIHSMLAAEPGPVHLIIVTSAPERAEIVQWFTRCARPVRAPVLLEFVELVPGQVIRGVQGLGVEGKGPLDHHSGVAGASKFFLPDILYVDFVTPRRPDLQPSACHATRAHPQQRVNSPANIHPRALGILDASSIYPLLEMTRAVYPRQPSSMHGMRTENVLLLMHRAWR